MSDLPRYQILSLDGGGIRGYLTVRLLEEFTKIRGLERAFDSVYLLAGNSSGALIALGMARARAAGIPMKDVLPNLAQLFRDGGKVFGGRWPYALGGFWLFSRYLNRARRRALEEQLANTKLRELGAQVVITTFDLDNKGTREEREERAKETRRWKPKVFHNFKRAEESLRVPGVGAPSSAITPSRLVPDREELAGNVALYSTAAPAYFPTADGYIDGGVYANNPAMCALAQMFDRRYEPLNKPALRDITMFSVSAGRNSTYITWMNRPWGGIPWLTNHYIDLPTEATVGIADYQCRQLLGEENYHRCDVDFTEDIAAFKLDDTGRISDIELEVNKAVNAPAFQAHVEWLKRYWIPRPAMVPVPSEVTSRHLRGATELTCLFPIKEGFVDVFETHTYATRLRILLRSLHSLRQASREVTPVLMIPDIVDTIRSIHSFRLSIIRNQLMLAVDFDRPWEPYMRIVWRVFGPLLDLILINCDRYQRHTTSDGREHPGSTTSDGFERFAAFLRQHQIEAELFYTASAHTVDDVAYLTQLEKRVREQGHDSDFDGKAATLPVDTPEAIARTATVPAEKTRQELKVLAVFYKLRELYREGDEDFLQKAATATLQDFDPESTRIKPEQRKEFRRELAWFESIKHSDPATDTRDRQFEQVQAGVVTRFPGVTHGCLLLASFEDPAQARACLSTLLEENRITRHGEIPHHGLFTNIAFTPQGLKRLGLPVDEFAALPKEFREGMEARAGMLGDIAANHPDNWTLPEWNWDGPGARQDLNGQMKRVRLSTIDVVIQLRKKIGRPATDEDADWPRHPLRSAVHAFVQEHCTPGIRVLSVQPMLQYTQGGQDGSKEAAIEHFGFLDGISQPRVDKKAARDKVSAGEIVLGYENDRGDPPYYEREDKRALGAGRVLGGLMDNGTFLVIRKLEQHVDNLDRKIAEFVADEKNGKHGLTHKTIYSKLMGRGQDGVPATGGASGTNDFDYARDDGTGCPLHAHIRLGNPRSAQAQGGQIPRIARRGMSYGPRWQGAGDTRERGMMFLSYNASISEQYEVIQRWMTAGNSTGEFSGRTDPFLRVAQKGREDTFLIPMKDDSGNVNVARLPLGDEPFVSLKWGMYLFVPSLAAIGHLATLGKPDELSKSMQVSVGQQTIEALTTDEAWRVALEDSTALSSGRTAAVCAAIRELHGGAVRTPGNLVLVANHELAKKVLGDETLFSVSEYRNRMRSSFGDIYLGLDKGAEYTSLSTKPNEAIHKYSDHEAFTVAQRTTQLLLSNLAKNASFPMRLSLETVVDQVLAELSAIWFGIPDGDVIRAGDKPEDGGNDQSLHCPYHFLAPSRYIFSSPRPRGIVNGAGQMAGRALRARIGELARDNGATRLWPDALPPIGRAVWEVSTTDTGEIDPDTFARLLIGAMEGMLPTLFGNFLKIMHVWLTDETLWRVQQTLLLTPLSDEVDHPEFERARATILPALLRTMQARPVPDMVYRTAKKGTSLGHVTVEEGDRVVVLIGSITRELAQNEERAAYDERLAAQREGRAVRSTLPDVYPVFGGNRDEAHAPTHACPGYHMALGVLAGMITALLEAGTFAPTPTPLLVNFTPNQAPAREPVVSTETVRV